ncbi:hypothetical protein PYCCODRAFT_169305 [Trametes coccinea BRFM310]|uniref:Uncharacterized protein n=1 Tax=Trametes coccinea (strain BRFM310) TaxID=1353009 RepID=A0A1Y2IS90_TRAC3|nr:hypothetical protein PYCCODRAFT_169305 [Trametes coccinea BRFM310]
MWLIDTRTGKLRYTADPSLQSYVALSHVWVPGEELSFQDLQSLHRPTGRKLWSNRLRRLVELPPRSVLGQTSDKVRQCCAFARTRGYRWLWVDSCCIDKTSSTELSEAINSMYQWYASATICYAYLHDVDEADNPRDPWSQFRQIVVFVSRRWRVIGTKKSLADIIEEVTGIDRRILDHERPLSSVSVAQRMSWACRRKTTRVEDEAYSLMGIFGVNIPVIYGEGSNAFYRLQEEILRRIPDQSIFAWGRMLSCWPHDQFNHFSSSPCPVDATQECLFALSPAAFDGSAHYVPLSLTEFYQCVSSEEGPVPEYMFTSYGIRTCLPRLLYRRRAGLAGEEMVEVIVLACKDPNRGIVALILRPTDGRTATTGQPNNQKSPRQFKVGARCDSVYMRGALLKDILQTVVDDSSAGFQRRTQMTSLYIPYRPYELATEPYPTLQLRSSELEHIEFKKPSTILFTCPCEVIIEGWTIVCLREAGYTVSGLARDYPAILLPSKGAPPRVTLCRGKETVTIELGPCAGQHASPARFLPPLTATATFNGSAAQRLSPKAAQSEDPKLTLLGGCRNDHVQDWPDGIASFSRDGVAVELKFSSWAVNVRVEGGDTRSFCGSSLRYSI